MGAQKTYKSKPRTQAQLDLNHLRGFLLLQLGRKR
jgi:hypothetical protein